jgi:hypothetical protein
MIDIKEEEDTIDIEYFQRVCRIKTKRDLIDLLDDYKEWLHPGLQNLREYSESKFIELKFQLKRHLQQYRTTGMQAMDPHLAVMLLAPAMLVAPRALAYNETRAEMKRRNLPKMQAVMTWGQAFLRILSEGYVKITQETEDKMYLKLLECEQQILEKVDTWSIGK